MPTATSPTPDAPQDAKGGERAFSELEVEDTRILVALVGPDREKLRILEREAGIAVGLRQYLYIVERQETGVHLRFKLTQNDSVKFDSREFTMPMSDRSIAGFAASRRESLNIEDAYNIPPNAPFRFASLRFASSFDTRTGYVTRSMLVAPLISQHNEVIGVIQLINKKRHPSTTLGSASDVDRNVVSFDARSVELLTMLSSQAGVSLETAMLYNEIRNLFDGFVSASVEAIESRDPDDERPLTSRRVAHRGAGQVISAETRGPYAGATFSAEDLRELEYASHAS